MLTVIMASMVIICGGQSFSFSIGLTPIPKISEEPASSSPLSDLEVNVSHYMQVNGMSVQRIVHSDFNSFTFKMQMVANSK